MRVADLLEAALAERGDASVRDLVAAVRAAGGHGVSRAAVERTLAADPRFSATGDAGKARWTLAGSPAEAPSAPAEAPSAPTEQDGEDALRAASRRRLAQLELRGWQAEALAAWT
ncbi:MAG: hypothetical protein ACLFRD_09715, partial [Nitriliruptoraceae bacterium]